ncbi:hypothetical protein ACHAWF_009119 [Thalassiosira exigua]
MLCVLAGIAPAGASCLLEDDKIWDAIHLQIANVNGEVVNWIASRKSHDDDGHPVTLVCATSSAPVDDIIAAASDILDNLGYSCELWASAPAILPLRPLCGYTQHLMHFPENSWEDQASSATKEWGMFVQTSVIEIHEVQILRSCVEEEIMIAENLIRLRRPALVLGKDIISFKEIASRGNDRFDLLLQPPSKARDIVEQVIIGRNTSILEQILGGRLNEDIDFDVSIVYSKPGAPNQGWHADGDHQKGANDAGWEIDGWKNQLAKPYALCMFIPLIDLDDETGYTQFWPASHRNRGLMGFGPVAEIAEATFDGKCKAGDAIWYDYRLMHRGMQNTSTLLRPVVQVLFKKNWYVEKRNYGTESLRETTVSFESYQQDDLFASQAA